MICSSLTSLPIVFAKATRVPNQETNTGNGLNSLSKQAMLLQIINIQLIKIVPGWQKCGSRTFLKEL